MTGASRRVARHGRPSAIASRAMASTESRSTTRAGAGRIGGTAVEGTRARSRASPAEAVFMAEGCTGIRSRAIGLDRGWKDPSRAGRR